MDNNVIKYPVTMHYEWHPTRESVYAIHIRFPDLLAIDLPAFTVGNNPKDAIAAAQDVLEMVVHYAQDHGIDLPKSTPLEKLSIDRGYNEVGEPFKIEIMNISIDKM